jgi:hypothetical protein
MNFFRNLFKTTKTVPWYDVFTGMNNPYATLGQIQQAAKEWGFSFYLFNGKVYPTSKQGTIDTNKDFICYDKDITACRRW